MKRLQRCLLLLALALIPFRSSINGCGWWYGEDEIYYNLFDQLLLKNEGLRPFLLTGEPGFFQTDTDIPDENIDAWMAFISNDRSLQKLDKAAVSQLVYRTPIGELSLNGPRGTMRATGSSSTICIQFIDYLRYARALEPYAQANTKSWEPSRAQAPSEDQYRKLLAEGMQRWKSCQYKELKLRYGYQLVRLAHYSGNNEEALELFDTYVEPVRQDHIIYYYALEQKAGVLYNLGRNAEANYLFCQVFDHSDCRKEIAYNSIRIQGEVDWDETYALCKTNKEKAVLYAVRGYNTFSNETEEMRNILQVCPDSPYLKLLAIRYINKLERSILDLLYTMGDAHPFMEVPEKVQAQYAGDKELINSILRNPQTGEKDFWTAYLAHMAFLCKDYRQCASLLDGINTENPELSRQISRTRFSLYLTTLNRLGSKEEESIKAYVAEENIDKDFVREIVAHLYKQQGEDGKAYLVHNRIHSLEQNPDITIINSLISEYHKHGDFSACISADTIDDGNILDLYELKGTYYLRMGKLDECLKWYGKVPDDYGIEFAQSPLIFSNGFKRWFNIPAEEEMTDVIYQQKEFSFLNKEHSKKSLVQSLQRLKEMAKKKNETGVRAAYLLANYYFNISAYGYYRNIPFYFSDNGFSSMHFGTSVSENEVPDFSKDYNYKYFTSSVLLTNDAFNALSAYKYVSEHSSDPELRARALFMASACTRDLHQWESETWEKVERYYSEITRQYSHTDFFKEAKNECKYFDYYIKNEL